MSRDDISVMVEAVIKLALAVLGGMALYVFLRMSSEEFYSLVDHPWIIVLLGIFAGSIPILLAVGLIWCDDPTSPARDITFDDKRQAISCRDGSMVSYSDLTVHIELIPGIMGVDDMPDRPCEYWVYLRDRESRFNLKLFRQIQQAKDHAREVRMRVTTGSCRTPWFPPDD